MLELLPYQKEAAKFLVSRRRVVLGSEMGTGKTPVSIRAVRYLRRKKLLLPQNTYVVCPASVKYNWANEIKRWDEGSTVQVVETKKDRIPRPSRGGGVDYIIFSYEIFRALAEELPNCGVLIFDESHKLKNKSAQVTKKALAFAESSQKVWFLTGTPMPNSIIDCYTTFDFCTFGNLGNYWQFAYNYCYVTKNRFGKKISGGKNLDELAEISKAFLHRDTIEDHLEELPDEQIIRIDLPHTSRSKKYIADEEMKAVVEKLIAQESLTEEEKGVSEHIASMRRELAEAKEKQAVEFIGNIMESGEQVIGFAHHLSLINPLAERLGVPKIVGATPAQERQRLIDEFQAGNIQCLVLGIQAASVGITLTKARISVFLEVPWVPADFDQARARIRRIGQKNFCTHYILSYPGTVDETALYAMQRKAKTINKFWEARK